MSLISFATYQEGDAEEMHEIIFEVFEEALKVHTSVEGISTFYQIINPEELVKRHADGAVLVKVIYDQLPAGFFELNGSHLKLIFIKKSYRGKGIARACLEWIQQYLVQHQLERRITLMSARPAAAVYTQMGFAATGPYVTKQGLTSLPMELRF